MQSRMFLSVAIVTLVYLLDTSPDLITMNTSKGSNDFPRKAAESVDSLIISLALLTSVLISCLIYLCFVMYKKRQRDILLREAAHRFLNDDNYRLPAFLANQRYLVDTVPLDQQLDPRLDYGYHMRRVPNEDAGTTPIARSPIDMTINQTTEQNEPPSYENAMKQNCNFDV